MKKLFFLAFTALALHSSATAQKLPDNCAKIQALIDDLSKNDLKTFRGPETVPGTYLSTVELPGFAVTTIDDGSFSFDFITRTAPTTDKAVATKTYQELAAQMKTCLKAIGYTGKDNSNEYVQETLFTKGEDAVEIHVSLQEGTDEYDVVLNLKKNKPREQE